MEKNMETTIVDRVYKGVYIEVIGYNLGAHGYCRGSRRYPAKLMF